MKQVLLLASLLLISHSDVYAYDPVFVESDSYEEKISVTGDPYVKREYLGELTGYPHTYELKTDVTFDFNAQLMIRAKSSFTPLNLIIVRQNDTDGGVIEIKRLNADPSQWQSWRSYTLGTNLLKAPVLQQQLTPGTYRIEVSSPDNQGSYMLIIGEEPIRNILSLPLDIIKIQNHFNYTPLRLLLAWPLVLVSLLFVLVINVIFKRYQNKHS